MVPVPRGAPPACGNHRWASMKSIIEQFRILNDVDLKLRTLRKDLERLPKELAVKEEEPKLLVDQIERRKAEIAKLQEQIEEKDEELKVGGAAMKRYSSQMSVLRTPKEFESVRRSIDAQKRTNQQIESQTLELMQLVENLQKESGEIQARLDQLNAALAAERKVVEAQVAEWKAEESKLAQQRAGMTKDLPLKELGIYDRIVVSRGDAISRVTGTVCSACYMGLPPQVHNMAILAKELVLCPSCGRILTVG